MLFSILDQVSLIGMNKFEGNFWIAGDLFYDIDHKTLKYGKEWVGKTLHITLTVLQAFDDEGDVAFFEGIHHATTFTLNAQDPFEAHVL